MDNNRPLSLKSGVASYVPKEITSMRWDIIVAQLKHSVGEENVVTDPVAVRATYDEIVQGGAEVRRHQVEQVTERFNTQLELFTEGKLPSGEKIGLGAPGATLLACGISDADITVTQRVLKNHMDKHALTADDIKSLPAALENPVMVYEWGAKAKATVVITEIARGDERIAVALKLKPGRNGAVVNAVASVHGKSVERLLANMNTPLTDFRAENLKWVEKEKVLDWITAGSSYGSSGSDQGLVTATNIVTNFENPKIGPENISRSIVADRTLVGVHNLTEENVLHAVRMGGLANPSLAVIDMEKDGQFDNFGDITLVAPRSLVDKSSGKNIGTYGADVYTPRYPYVEREYGVKLQQFAREVDEFIAAHFDPGNPVARRYTQVESYMQPQYAANVERAVKREPFMQAYYAKEVLGVKIPHNATVEQIGELIPDMATYFEWMNRRMGSLAEREVIPNGYTPSGRQRYLDHTLENVSRFMKSRGRAGDEGYNYGLGTLRSHFTPRFANLSQIRSAKSRLQAPDEFRRTKQIFQDEYDVLLQQLSDTNVRRDLVKDADSHLASAMLSNNLQVGLEKFGYKPSDELLTRISEFRKALRRMPSEYFETKFERPVYLNEFAGAVVRDDVAPTTVKALEASGIGTIVTYDPTQQGARETALRTLSAEIDPRSNVCFMRTPQGEVYGFTTGGKIYLDGARMNAETPMHEYAELWSQIVAREQPGLWERGVELMKQTAVWDQVNADPNYKHLPEELRASETLSRVAAGIFDEKQATITDDDGLFGKLRDWLREIWDALKATFSKWTKRDLEKLSADDFARMPLRDFVEGIDLRKYGPEREVQRIIKAEKQAIRERTQADGTYLKAPNGEQSKLTADQWETVRTRQFKEWFGDWENDPETASKVVDGNGEPMVVHHGTDSHFSTFRKSRRGIWFTPNFDRAQRYATAKTNDRNRNVVVPAFLNLKNPDSKEYDANVPFNQRGHDGWISRFDGEGEDGRIFTIVVANPNQVKSATENNGAFDATNPDIRFSFIGEKGAGNLDKAEEATGRLDNLGIARDMEKAGKDARAVKIATGWERGADGKWRYETIDVVLNEAVLNRLRNEVSYQRAFTNLGELVGSSNDVMRAYPELSSVRVIVNKDNGINADGGYTDDPMWGKTITLSRAVIFSTSAQDALKQYLESDKRLLWAKRGYDIALGECKTSVSEQKTLVADCEREYEEHEVAYERAVQESTQRCHGILVHELQHIIQDIEGFAKGGNPEVGEIIAKQNDTLTDWQRWFVEDVADYERVKDKMRAGYTLSVFIHNLARDVDRYGKDMARDIIAMNDDELRREYDRLSQVPRRQTPFETYLNLAGETEARNTAHRLAMSPDERRVSLAAETEDRPRKDQIVISPTRLTRAIEERLRHASDSKNNTVAEVPIYKLPNL